METRSDRSGIEAIAVALPRSYVELRTLAEARGVDPAKYRHGLGARHMAVPAPDEDTVALAANAARGLLERFDVDPASIGMVAVGTETAVDAAKPIAGWLHGLLDLPRACRVFDVQHACYGGTAALRAASMWAVSGLAAGRRALVVAADVARYDEGTAGEPTQGAGAVAMLVGTDPRVAAIEPFPEALHAHDVGDFWRPLYRDGAIADGHYSIRCYLEALQHCWTAFAAGSGLRLDDFDHFIYHAPFPRMARKAHLHLRALTRLGGGGDPGRDEEDFVRRAAPSLWANAAIGNAYSASAWISLVGLLENRDVDAAGSRTGLFSYGSGNCAELLSLRIGPDASAWQDRTGLRESLRQRTEISYREYIHFRRGAEELARNGSFGVPVGADGFAFCGVTDHRRIYRDMRDTDALSIDAPLLLVRRADVTG